MFACRHRPALWVVIATAVLGACTTTSSVGDRHFEAGDYQQAVVAYQASLLREPNAAQRQRALYRLGVLQALPNSSAFDSDRAIEALQTLLAESPETAYRVEAAVLLDLLVSRRELGRDLAARRDLVAALTQELARLQGEVQRVEGEAGARQVEVLEMSDKVDRLQREISFLSQEVSRREQELEKLKAIDLDGTR